MTERWGGRVEWGADDPPWMVARQIERQLRRAGRRPAGAIEAKADGPHLMWQADTEAL